VPTDGLPAAVTQRLRTETRAAHDRLESDLDLLDGRLGPDRYRLLLERFLGFHRVLEPRLDRWHDATPLLDWPVRRKTALLLADLADLGVDGSALDAVPDCPEVPDVDGSAAALGVLYVVEGATLGGRLIAERLRDGVVPATALRFFGSYGDEVGRRWHHWRAVTTTWVGADAGRADAVVRSATGTFEVLGRWLAPAAARRAA
jgi:heme oxygenase